MGRHDLRVTARRAGRHAAPAVAAAARARRRRHLAARTTPTSGPCSSPSSTTPAIPTPTRASPRATARAGDARRAARRRRSSGSRSSTSAPSRWPSARRLADGRSSFVARVVGGPDRLVCFERTREYESSAVHLAVATRRARGAAPRPGLGAPVHAGRGGHVGRHPLVDQATVERRSSSASHRTCRPTPTPSCWPTCSSSAPTGWRPAVSGRRSCGGLDGDPHELERLGLQASVPIPPLDLRRRAHFAALLNALSQYDRAALVDPQRSGPDRRRAPAVVRAQPPRHPAAPRHPAHVGPALHRRLRPALVFVVSSNGTLSVFHRGERLVPP